MNPQTAARWNPFVGLGETEAKDASVRVQVMLFLKIVSVLRQPFRNPSSVNGTRHPSGSEGYEGRLLVFRRASCDQYAHDRKREPGSPLAHVS